MAWDRTLADPAFLPIYEAAAALDLPVCVHLGWASPQVTELFTDSQAFFDLSSAELKPVLRRVLAVIVERVKEMPNTIAISGHTDARQYHNRTFYSNWELSSARAHNARRAMEDLRFPGTRVDRVVGYADRLPLSPDDPLDPANRRISILVLKEPEPVKNAAATAEQNPVAAARASLH